MMILKTEQMQATFNAKERTLEEMREVALTAGWKITEVIRKPQGSLFGSIVAVPTAVPPSANLLFPSAEQKLAEKSVSPPVDTSYSRSQLPSPKGAGMTISRSDSVMRKMTKVLRRTISKRSSRAGQIGELGEGGKVKPVVAGSTNP